MNSPGFWNIFASPTLIGSIPAPVILGGIMDEMCLAWHRPCGSSGNCIAYQNEDMARGMFYALVAMLSMSTLLFYLSLLAHRRRARKREAARSMQALFIGSGIHSIGTPKDTNDVSSPISR
ncbi:solute carrier organic anion transporter family member 4A1-like [Dermacentor silvarum]|uniref:solute carrier organic anion transporter family member 4A1-like n=1 Tax=Dermacentor silvarum TaxID=543639 RepID=UPI0021012AEF|nr:solute carrier organic anion transporter family member 4A1-like [Dermacentor silvarum]